jgi:small subunit ribosomal protein S13
MKEKQKEINKIEEDKQKVKVGRPGEKKIDYDFKLVRILSKDINGKKKVYLGLTDIKGVSWAFSNIVCKKLNMDKNKKIQDLNEQEIKSIEALISNPINVPTYLLNRRKDRDDGTDKHIHGSDLDLQREFDIKRMKKIKSYKGTRHSLGQPVRGQRTKSHFRSNKKKSGMGVAKTTAVKPKPKVENAKESKKK